MRAQGRHLRRPKGWVQQEKWTGGLGSATLSWKVCLKTCSVRLIWKHSCHVCGVLGL